MQEIIMPFDGQLNIPSDEQYHSGKENSENLSWLPESLTDQEKANLSKKFDPVTIKYIEPVAEQCLKVIPYSSGYYRKEQLKRVECLNKYLKDKAKADARFSVKQVDTEKDWDIYLSTKHKHKLEFEEIDPWYSSVTVYKQDVVVRTKFIDHSKVKIKGKRGRIKALSVEARKRFKLHLRNIKEGSLNLFVTLTYGAYYPTDGKEVKKHLKSMRDWMLKQGVRMGVWFLEFQKRGAPHFHFFIEGNYTLSSAKVAAAWARRIKKYLPTQEAKDKLIAVHQGNVKNGRPCVEYVKKPHALSYYSTKYATKAHQKEVPDDYQNVGRFWGYWGDAKPSFQVNVYRGLYPVQALKSLLMSWRFRWKMQKDGFITENDMKERSSGILWGGAQVLDELLDAAEFCPF